LHVTISTNDSTTESAKEADERIVYMEDLEKRKQAYGICGECNEPGTGENWCQPCNAKRFKDNFKIGLVEIKILMILYNNHNLMLFTNQNILNGYLLKILRMSLYYQRWIW
jgi:hypothetical protein